jgi:HAD superfamily hydrolase (TIGR01450 family)
VKIAANAHRLPPVKLDFDDFEAILLDLDGTFYYEEHPLPGAVELVRRLQAENRKFACISNSTTSPQRINQRLRMMGINIQDESHIYTAGAAACDYVVQNFPPRPRVFNLATGGVREMLDGKVDWVEAIDQPCDAVIVGAPSNEFAQLPRQRIALRLLRVGARLVGICNDRVYPTSRALELGSGALSAMMSFASGAAPVFCGKPEAIFFRTLCERLNVDPAKCLLIGDNLESDIAGGKAMGMRTILTLTGVTRAGDLVKLGAEMQPDQIVQGLSNLC